MFNNFFKKEEKKIVNNVDGIVLQGQSATRNSSRFRALAQSEILLLKRLIFVKKTRTAFLTLSVLILVTIFLSGSLLNNGSTESGVKGKVAPSLKILDSEWFYDANRLEIPSIDLMAKVSYPKNKKEISEMAEFSITHLYDSDLPGKEGVSIFSIGASGGANNQINISRINPGDDIYLIKSGTKYHYKATDHKKISINDRSIYGLVGNKLVLIVSGSAKDSATRDIVICDQVN